MIRSRRASASTARLVRPSAIAGTVAESGGSRAEPRDGVREACPRTGKRKNPRDLRLAGSRSSQPPSAPRALVPQATSASAASVAEPAPAAVHLAALRPPVPRWIALRRSVRGRAPFPAPPGGRRSGRPFRPRGLPDPGPIRSCDLPGPSLRVTLRLPFARSARSRRSHRLLGASRTIGEASGRGQLPICAGQSMNAQVTGSRERVTFPAVP